MAGAPVTRTVSIYIDQAAAEQSADRLAKKIERINATIERNKKLGKETADQETQLAALRERHATARAIADGRATASIRQMSQYVGKLRNELLNMSKDAPGYAKKFEEFRNASQRLQELNRELNSVNSRLQETARPGVWSRIKQGVAQGFGMFAGMGIANMATRAFTWLKDIANDAADAAIKMEALEVAYTTLLGSRTAAKEMIRDLQKFSLATPFEFTQVADLTKQLLAYGFAQKEIIPTMQMLGDVAGGVGTDKLPQLVKALGDTRAAGRLTGQEMLQYINTGFSPLQVISEKTGRSMADLKKDMEAGLITFDMVNDAFKTATSEGGNFYNMMSNQSKTTSGAIAAFKDLWGQFMIDLGNGTTGPMKGLYVMLGDIVNTFRDWVALSPADEIAKEKDEVNNLVHQLIRANEKGSDRNAIIAELNAKYPTLLNNIDLEKASTNQLVLALQSINSQYRDRIRLAASAAAAEKKAQENVERQQKLNEDAATATNILREYFNEQQIANMNFEKMSNQELQGIVKRIEDQASFWSGDGEVLRGLVLNIREGNKILEQNLKEGEELNQHQKDLEVQASESNSIRRRIVDLEKQRAVIEKEQSQVKTLVGQQQIKDFNAEIERLKKEQKEAEEAAKQTDKPAATPVNTKAEKAAERARKKAEKEHKAALEKIQDIGRKLDEMKAEVAGAALDAEAGFEDKAKEQIIKVTNRYGKLIEDAKDLMIKAAGLTRAEKKELQSYIDGYSEAMQSELSTLYSKQFKDRSEHEYFDTLKGVQAYFDKERQIAGNAYVAGITSRQQYQQELLRIDKEEAQARVEAAEDYAGTVKKAAQDLESYKTDAQKRGITERERLEQQGNQEALARAQRAVLLAPEGSGAQLRAKKRLLEEQFLVESEQMDKTSEMYLTKQQELHKTMQEMELQFWMDKAQIIGNALSELGNIFSSYNSILSNRDQSRLAEDKARNEKTATSYQRMLDNKQITQEQYNRYIDTMNAEQEKKEKEAKAREAKRNKAAAYFNAVISTAQAVAQALTVMPPWLGIALAAIVGVSGGVQIAAISSEKEPTFKYGGWFNPKNRRGGISSGPSHANGGIEMIDGQTGKKVGEMEGNEAYMILSQKVTKANRPLIDALLAASLSDSDKPVMPWIMQRPAQMDYAKAIDTVEYSRKYRSGGLTGPISSGSTPVTNTDPQMALLMHQTGVLLGRLEKKLNEPFKGYVVYNDIIEKQKQMDRLLKSSGMGS